MLRAPGGGKPSTSNNAALSVFLRVRPPGVPDADLDRLTGRRTYQILEDQATLRTFPPLSAGHSRTINRQVGWRGAHTGAPCFRMLWWCGACHGFALAMVALADPHSADLECLCCLP